MRIPRTLRAGLLIAAAVVLGLLAVQGTYALWNAGTSAAPGTVTSASFDVSLTASPSGQCDQHDPSRRGGHYQPRPAANTSPGTSVYASLAVGNNTNAGGNVQHHHHRWTPSLYACSGSGTLAQYVKVSAKIRRDGSHLQVLPGYAITDRDWADVRRGSQGDRHRLSASKSASIPATPSAVKGTSREHPFPLTARQLCGVPGGC